MFEIDTNKVKADVDKLLDARNFIANPDNWTIGALGRLYGQPVLLHSMRVATQVCGAGCLYKFDLSPHTMNFVHQTSLCLYGTSLSTVNDQIGHKAVLEVFDEAIRRVKEL